MPLTALRTFGAGGAEPYGAALRDGDRVLHLIEQHPDGPERPGDPDRRVDVARFRGAPDEADHEAIRASLGPVLDVGCGPGRMLRAAASLGRVALGIDVSPAAVRIARRQGLPVLRRSVFEPVPGSGRWGTAILMDGNIGIGGDPAALLARCAALVSPHGGRIVVESHPDPLRDRAFESVLVDDLGRRSAAFAWAEVGAVALREHAAAAGLARLGEWTLRGRGFAAYVRGYP